MRDFFVRYRDPVGLVLALVLMAGLFAYTHIHSSLFPEVTFPKVKIIADNGLQPVDKMMVTVTRPLEAAIERTPMLQDIRSVTSRGSCEISAFLDWNADVDLGKQQIATAIEQVRGDLPPGTNISVEKMDPSILPIMGFTIAGGDKDPIELDLIANYVVRPYLTQVGGVSEVRVIGGRKKEYRVTLRTDRLAQLGVTPDSIAAALGRTNFIRSDGFLFTGHRMYLTVTDATVRSLRELQDLVVANDGRRVLHLSDLADVAVQEAPQYLRINANGRDAVLIAVVRQPGANVIDVSDGVRQRVQELNDGLLPSGVHLAPYYVQADFVSDSIHSVRDALLIGMLLAIVVAMIFLRSWRSSLVLLLTIPITLAFTLVLMHAFGFTLNIMTLGAVAAAIGLVIDDAIVVVEQLHRTHEEHPGRPSAELVGDAVRFLFPAMVGSSLSTIVIFLPFVLLSGVAGAYFKVLADTMMITLGCSFLISWIGLPVIYLLLPKEKIAALQPAHDVEGKERVTRTARTIGWLVRRPWISLTFIVLLVVAAIWALGHIGSGFLPEMDEGSIVLDYDSPPGTSLEETDRMLREVERTFAAVPEIATYSRRTGTQMGFFITEPSRGDYLIQLRKDRKRTTDEVIDDIRQRVEASQPALRVDFGQVIGDMLGDLMSSTQPIEIKVFGTDRQVLRKLAKRVAGIVERVPGTADVFDGITIAGPSIAVVGDQRELALRGLSSQDLDDQVRLYGEGTIIGEVLETEQMVPVRMAHRDAGDLSMQQLRGAPIFLPNGRTLGLGSLATITAAPGDAEVEREDLQLMVPVTARLNGRDLGSVMHDIQHAVRSAVQLPKGYHIAYGGAFQEQQRSFQELARVLLAASLLVFTVLLFLFRDLRAALVVLFVALLGIGGCVLALYVTGTPLNVGSYTGIIMIVGIIGENAIFTYRQYAHVLPGKGVHDALVYAIGTRLRPKLMTAIGAIVALAPVALGIGVGAQLHQPLAIAVIGGFVTGLPLLLVVLPSLLRLVVKR
ncbi:MAG: efflux RND transporter permease subunit [Flavobacteriales bacterium]|nr:efflux RND transporter permease subunit [Flavobacteriales bacterium]